MKICLYYTRNAAEKQDRRHLDKNALQLKMVYFVEVHRLTYKCNQERLYNEGYNNFIDRK